MDELSHNKTFILFLKGVHINQYVSIEQRIQQRSLQTPSLQVIQNKNILYFDKIPPVYNFHDWIENTNLKCWNCDSKFNTVPIFIPTSIDGSINSEVTNTTMKTVGNFCWFNCAATYINNHYHSDEKWKYLEYLKILYHQFTKKYIVNIIPAPNRTDNIEYGGLMTIEDIKKRIAFLKAEE
jgi:hypothetical protein